MLICEEIMLQIIFENYSRLLFFVFTRVINKYALIKYLLSDLYINDIY